MNKKPEKIHTCPKHHIYAFDCKYCDEDRRYNQACDDWEEFLPNTEEIKEMLKTPNFDLYITNDKLRNEIAKTISKRIKGGG